LERHFRDNAARVRFGCGILLWAAFRACTITFELPRYQGRFLDVRGDVLLLQLIELLRRELRMITGM